MADNETIADIIAEIRALSNPISDGIIAINGRIIADRLEAAHKRELDEAERRANHAAMKNVSETLAKVGPLYDAESIGNAAKLREALVSVQKKIHYLIGSLNVPNSLVANRMEINGIINAALAAPVRNCDVGVPEERIQRWSKFCKARSKKLPPIHGFEWEDYPYEEGGDK